MNRFATVRPAASTCLWDSHYGPSTAAFSNFRKFVCRTFFPWSLERQYDDVFHGRAEGLILPMGALIRTKSTPVIAARNRAELEDSPTECIYASYVLSGELRVQQGGHDLTAKLGDLIIYESRLPVVTEEKSTGSFESLSFRIDRTQFTRFERADALLSCSLISAESMITPLKGYLNYLSESLLAIPIGEAVSLVQIFGSLLPVAVLAISNAEEGSSQDSPKTLTRQLLEYVEAKLATPDLSPRSAAAELGVSVRYVHKLFAEKGMTFCSYVTSKRLDGVRRDLDADAFRQEPIYVIAARWGLNDPSAFNRIFKEKFGMTPGRMRALGL